MKARGMKNLMRMGFLAGAMLAWLPSPGVAAEWVHEGMAEPGKWTTGIRVGPSFITQPSQLDTTGPALNFQALYGINRWFRLGAMLEWENHGLDQARGSLDTISLLPLMLEFRPGHIGGLIPYRLNRYRRQYQYQRCERHLCVENGGRSGLRLDELVFRRA